MFGSFSPNVFPFDYVIFAEAEGTRRMCPGYTWKWLVLVVNQWIQGLIWSLGVVQLERPCCSSFYHTKQSWLRSARVRGRWGYGLVKPEPTHKRLRAQNDRKMDLDFSQVPC